jgi:hypothetical protein
MNELTPDQHRILVGAIHDSATVVHKGRMMNERIKELLEQAGVKYSVLPEGTVYEKFAELIVQDAVLSEREECAKVADRQNGDDEQDPESCVWSKAARHIAAAIRARGSE